MIDFPIYEGLVYRACSMLYYRVCYGVKGSRLMAGRFNKKGEAALYVATHPYTAWKEFQRGNMTDPQPCAIVAARLKIRHVVDLRGDLTACHPDIQNWGDDWEDARNALNRGDPADCASWRCKDLATNAHKAGYIYPSVFDPNGSNIVVYTEDVTSSHFQLEVIDNDDVISKAAKGVV